MLNYVKFCGCIIIGLIKILLRENCGSSPLKIQHKLNMGSVFIASNQTSSPSTLSLLGELLQQFGLEIESHLHAGQQRCLVKQIYLQSAHLRSSIFHHRLPCTTFLETDRCLPSQHVWENDVPFFLPGYRASGGFQYLLFRPDPCRNDPI